MLGTAARLRNQILDRRLTLLGVGPMSSTVVGATIELANEFRTPIALIPSRRQVDSETHGGGYVEGWTTAQFANLVRSTDLGGYVLLSRDHSGPWQGSNAGSADSSVSNAMAEAKAAIADDIKCGFDLIHVDPSPALARGFAQDDVDDMAVELIAHAVREMEFPEQCAFEVGTDEQDMIPEQIPVLKSKIERLLTKLDAYKLPAPLFYVAQTGTKVAETRNIGSFDQLVDLKGSLPATLYMPEILRMLRSEGLLLKEHNADYQSDWSLTWHRRFGIHAANVAPEFGVTETNELVEVLQELGMAQELEDFCSLVVAGRNWKKWTLPDADYTDRDLMRIAGHYHFADERVIDIRKQAQSKSAGLGWSSEDRIKSSVRAAIMKYLVAFGYGC